MANSLWMLVGAILLILTTEIECNTKSDCGVAQTAFGMCVPYVMGMERGPSSSCCLGVKSVKELSPTPTSRRGMCGCLRGLMAQVGKIDSRRASGLAARCRIRTDVIPTSLRFSCYEIV